jgi:hypothetical protein
LPQPAALPHVHSYTLAADNESRKVLRVVCRWDFSPTLTKELLDDLQEALDWLEVRRCCSGKQCRLIDICH